MPATAPTFVTSSFTFLGIALAAMLPTTVAQADPLRHTDTSLIVDTHCSANQIMEAVHHEAPLWWDRWNTPPTRMESVMHRLDEFLEKNPDDRRKSLDAFTSPAHDWAAKHPEKARTMEKHREQVHSTIDRVFSTCDYYKS